MAARVSFTIRVFTVTNKSLHLANHFVDVSTVLLHKMYISRKSRNSEKPNIFARFFDKCCFIFVIFQYLFYSKLW